MDRKAAIESAILRLTPDQFTKDGRPLVAAVNARMSLIYDRFTAKERDALWVEREAEAKDAGAPAAEIEVEEPAPEGWPDGKARITITSSMSNPVQLYVHGVGSWSIRVGEAVTLPVEALDALRNSDCTFTQE